MKQIFLPLLLILTLVLSACVPAATPAPSPAAEQPQRLQVVATTSIVADVVKNISGERVLVLTMLPDWHGCPQLRTDPAGLAIVADAQLVFVKAPDWRNL